MPEGQGYQQPIEGIPQGVPPQYVAPGVAVEGTPAPNGQSAQAQYMVPTGAPEGTQIGTIPGSGLPSKGATKKLSAKVADESIIPDQSEEEV
eukprot:CAMPEP_0205799450 /NCGR_PEP_ID=MMETSP0205-20121125/716_1 /ASSEMBLY_ACC=CAM_ASM_000278 /TAXON_ID=36767 /ORGANISM="Euplotes focardii, Strain TN1" /LENGTH=91 /DNA_ID=CAMNT_0053060765 /DNA_START=385 /DNA_END=656 /DNA_ORIENTATION=-